MSHIPNNAIPHATANNETETRSETDQSSGLSSAFGQLSEKVREYPKTAAAAGAAVAVGAGIVAARAIRGRGDTGGRKGSTGKKDSSRS